MQRQGVSRVPIFDDATMVFDWWHGGDRIGYGLVKLPRPSRGTAATAKEPYQGSGADTGQIL